MPPGIRYLAPALLLAIAFVAGCNRQSPAEQASALAAEITEIRTQLPADPSAEQADEITQPAKRAAKAYAALTALAEKNPTEGSIAAARAFAESDFVVIRRIHRLATERHGLADLLGSLKVRGYRAARTVAVPKLADTLATAARRAAETDFDRLPDLVRETATLAALLTEVAPGSAVGRETAPTLTRDDWLRAAGRLDSFNRNEPAEFALGLGIIYGVIGRNGFALVELERAETARFDRAELAPLVPLARALVLSRLGFTELAAREASRLTGDTEQGRQLLAATHVTLAYCYGAKKDWKQMDRELGEAVRIWPNNPLVVYLSGERLLADGRKEQALETLARASTGTDADAAWLAPLLEKRIREVRDSRGDIPPLILDNEFIVKAVLLSLVAEARQTELGRRLAAFVAAAHLMPSLTGADTTEPATTH
jgi:tetratricopeptide (TPR) repeat protein